MSDESKTAGDAVTVYYWGIPWRGNFAKIIAADAGKEFTTAPGSEVVKIMKSPPSAQPLPLLAPPFVKVGSFTINQTPAACQYLARKLGYEPESAEQSAIALKVVLDINDFLMEITRNNGHQMWDEEAWTPFIKERAVRWLGIFDAVAGMNEGDFIFGAKICYADLAIGHFLSLMTNFGLGEYCGRVMPKAKALGERVLARPGVAALYAEQAKTYGTNTCGGQIQKNVLAMVAKDIHADVGK